MLVAGCPCALLGAAPFAYGAALAALAKRCSASPRRLLPSRQADRCGRDQALAAAQAEHGSRGAQQDEVYWSRQDGHADEGCAVATPAAPHNERLFTRLFLRAGQFDLVEFVVFSSTYTKEQLHRWLAAVEVRDNHPIARSIVQSYTGCVVSSSVLVRCISSALGAISDAHRL